MRLALVLVALVFINCYVFLWRDHTSVPAVMKQAQAMGNDEAATTAPTPAAAGDDPGGATDEVAADGELAPAPSGVIDGEVAKGDTVGKILRSNGLSAAEADELLRALSGVFDFKTLRPGQRFRIERGPDGRVASFELVVSKIITVRAHRDDRGELIAVEDQAETHLEVEEVGGKITSSLYMAVKGAGERTSLVAFFVDVFAYDLDFYNDTHEGDVFRVLVEKEYKGTEFLRYGHILAAEYAGKAGTFQAFWYQPAGTKKGRYFDAKGQSLEKTLLKTPLKYARVSSKFNPHRMHPILHKVRGHFGVDYAAPVGTPVWAAASGTIVKRAPSGGAGNLVEIKHDGGLVTQYMHLSKFAPGQKVGQRVEAKTVIGYVGTTGLSTGPHLHFGVKKNGAHIDPLTMAPQRAAGIAKKDAAGFRAAVAERQGRMNAISIREGGAGVDDDKDEIPDDGSGVGGVGTDDADP
ncbi:MAG: peptidoglycan DD-metalloendopeptidase family protein [Kofleriaceae bacterium]|nr:peptidoglycan DD-metalloendopeptidase family protein [Kofleriaceae bacterium]